MSDSTEPFWLFLHIPKAAGTTLRSIVDLQYGEKTVLTYYNQNSRQLLDNLPYMLLDGRRGYRALIGHYSFGVHRGLPRPARYVTFMREPVSRAISAYYENLKTNPGRLAKPDGTLRTLGEEVAASPESYANQQLKMLAGVPDTEPLPEDAATKARANLEEHFSFVGTVERFDESILLLGKAIGWKPCRYGRLNRGRPPEVDAEIRSELTRLNEPEGKLYADVCARLDAAIMAKGEIFSTILAEHRSALGGGEEAMAFAPGENSALASFYAEGSVDRVRTHCGL